MDYSDLSVKTVLIQAVYQVQESVGFEKAAIAVGDSEHKVVVVTDREGRYRGLITADDITAALTRRVRKNTPIHSFMELRGFCVDIRDTVLRAAEVMQASRQRFLAVLENDRIMGVVTAEGIMLLLHRCYQETRDELTMKKRENDEKDELISFICDDLKPPLSVIRIGCRYLTTAEVEAQLQDDLNSHVRLIERNIDRAMHQMDEIIGFLRAKTPHEMVVQDLHLGKYLGEQYGDADQRRFAHLNTFFDAVEDFYLPVDPEVLGQVLDQLIVGAMRVSHGKNVDLHVIPSTMKDGSNCVTFSIRDRGPGLSDLQLKNLFCGDGSVNIAAVKKYGMGLAIIAAQQCARLHNGTVTVTNHYAGDRVLGGEVAIHIPHRRSSRVHAKQPVVKQRRVLVVEDDPAITSYAKEELTEAGYQVATAANGEEALLLYKRQRPDIVFSDLNMPKLTGIELLTAIKLESPSTPVILCSSNYPGMDKELNKTLFKPDAFVEKPYAGKQLRAAVGEVLTPSVKSTIAPLPKAS